MLGGNRPSLATACLPPRTPARGALTPALGGFASARGIVAGTAMPRPSATLAANFGETVTSIDTARSRIAGTVTLLSSRRNAAMMCACSTGVWLSKKGMAWLKCSANFSGLPRTLSCLTDSGNDTKPAVPASNGQPPARLLGSYDTRPRWIAWRCMPSRWLLCTGEMDAAFPLLDKGTPSVCTTTLNREKDAPHASCTRPCGKFLHPARGDG